MATGCPAPPVYFRTKAGKLAPALKVKIHTVNSFKSGEVALRVPFEKELSENKFGVTVAQKFRERRPANAADTREPSHKIGEDHQSPNTVDIHRKSVREMVQLQDLIA